MDDLTTKKDEESQKDVPGADLAANINVGPTDEAGGVKDSPKETEEGNQPEEEQKVEEKPQAETVKDSVEGQPGEAKDVAAAISAANEKTMKSLEEVVSKLPADKLKELEGENPKLVEKLKNRNPELFKVREEGNEERSASDVQRLSKVIESLLSNQEAAQFDAWRESNKITEADYTARKQEFEETAKTLVDAGVVKDLSVAMEMAGNIVFPHLSGKPVDATKLKKMQGQNVTTSVMAPSNEGEFSDEDLAIMKREGMTEEAYRKAQKNEIFAPGIN